MEIKQLTQEDAEKVQPLLEELSQRYQINIGESLQQSAGFVGYEEGNPVSFIAVTQNPLRRMTFQIGLVGTTENEQGKGNDQLMVKHIEEFLVEQVLNGNKATLMVVDGDEGFYKETMGYALTGALENGDSVLAKELN